MNVAATLEGNAAHGTLTTSGKVGGDVDGTFAVFDGTVTCIDVNGTRAVVGAVGTASVVPPGPQPPSQLPGSYVQLLTLEEGQFTDPFLEESPTYPFRFGMLGEHYEGLQSEAQPNCEAGVFPTTLLPTMGGTLQISSTPTEQPSSESTGTTNPNGSTTASGSERGQSSPPPVYKDVPAHARTKITHVKKSGGRITVTFTEVDGSRGLRFMCGIDRHPAIRCTSPATLRLAPGVHRLKIASVGNRGELTSVPAYIRLTVRR